MSDPLVDLDEVKAHLKVSDVDETQLMGFIEAASAYIQNLTGPISAEQFVETHNGGSPLIALYHPPVLTVDEVIEYIGPTGYTLTAAELGQTAGPYTYSLDDARAGILRRRYTGGVVGSFAAGERNVKVTYTAGLATVPADIRMAVLQDIAGLYQPSQEGANPYFNNPDVGNAPLNPVGMFPRVAAILTAAARRSPSIA